MEAECIAAAPQRPRLGAGGHAQELGDRVSVSGRRSERDEPGIRGEVIVHIFGFWVVVGFVREQKDGGRAKDKSMAQVPAEHVLEGLGAVLALP